MDNFYSMPSLFQEECKDDFDGEVFKEKCLTLEFKHALGMAAQLALAQMTNLDDLPKRILSDILTDRLFRNLHHQLVEHGLAPDAIKTSQSGNERQYIIYNGYAFLVKRKGAHSNDTLTEKKIKKQDCAVHVLKICYDVDDLWSSIISMEIAYEINDRRFFGCQIDISAALDDYIDEAHVGPESNPPMPDPVVTTKTAAKGSKRNVM